MKPVKFLLKRAIVLFICLAIPWGYAAAQPLAFGNIEPALDFSKISNDKRFKCKRTGSPVAEQTCRLMSKYEEEFYDMPLLTLTLNYSEDQLRSIIITFENIYFEAVTKALEQDYGPPGKRMVEKYVTRRARLFRGYVHVWENNALMIDAIEHFSAAGDSAVVYKLDSYR